MQVWFALGLGCVLGAGCAADTGRSNTSKGLDASSAVVAALQSVKEVVKGNNVQGGWFEMPECIDGRSNNPSAADTVDWVIGQIERGVIPATVPASMPAGVDALMAFDRASNVRMEFSQDLLFAQPHLAWIVLHEAQHASQLACLGPKGFVERGVLLNEADAWEVTYRYLLATRQPGQLGLAFLNRIGRHPTDGALRSAIEKFVIHEYGNPELYDAFAILTYDVPVLELSQMKVRILALLSELPDPKNATKEDSRAIVFAGSYFLKTRGPLLELMADEALTKLHVAVEQVVEQAKVATSGAQALSADPHNNVPRLVPGLVGPS